MNRAQLRTRCVVAAIALGAISATSQSFQPTTLVVRLRSNRFVPADIRVRPGDTVRFVNGEGGPHNVEFEKDSISPIARAHLQRAMGKDTIRALASTFLILPDETLTLVVPDLPAGRYPLLCGPHYGNMRGSLIVEREK